MTPLLVRHASAGDADDWRGDDRLRPLDAKGRRQAEALVLLLSEFDLDCRLEPVPALLSRRSSCSPASRA